LKVKYCVITSMPKSVYPNVAYVLFDTAQEAIEFRRRLQKDHTLESHIDLEAKARNEISKLEWSLEGGLTVWFEGSKEPWSIFEFVQESPTRNMLESLEQVFDHLDLVEGMTAKVIRLEKLSQRRVSAKRLD
jgi:hypothetical protein